VHCVNAHVSARQLTHALEHTKQNEPAPPLHKACGLGAARGVLDPRRTQTLVEYKADPKTPALIPALIGPF
jgi:hypothetical protein